MKPLPKEYDPKLSEAHWQRHWLESGTYAFRGDQPRDNTFVIDTPPPTVSGVLHMGHVFSYCQADFVARYQRMRGRDVFYPMGFDDNGLPTERLVEKTLNIRAHNLPREEFVAKCREVVKGAEEAFRTLFRSIALSVDWKLEYQTISDEVRKLSQASFIELLQQDRAYRQLQPMLWDTVDQTAIAQAEVVDKEMPSYFCDIIFGVEGVYDTVTIATTRPELLGACVAVFYHPDDARYQHLKGKLAITPLFGAKVPILADETVKMEKGTGLVMCCTFGDETDIFWWRTHKLDTRIILNKFGKIDFCDDHTCHYIHTEAWNVLHGLKVKEAREKSIELLKAHKLLGKQEAITHAVKCAERSGAPLEILPTHQWFVKVLDIKDELKARASQCAWHPEYMKIRMEQWIDGLNWDWCVSRQRFFGVPFPVWYSKQAGEEGKILLPQASQLPVDPLQDLPKGYSREEVTGDPDVMDTWATSSLTPFISSRHSRESGNPSDMDPGLRRDDKVPADLRPQAHEIIRTWAFYTIVKAHLHAQTIPWKNLMISGWCLAPDKTKMSKSKGNVVTPVALIEEKGADAVRYWASTSRLGADTAFSEESLKIGRKLVTKLWNAGNFVALQLGNLKTAPIGSATKDHAITNPLDRWILTRLHRAVAKASEQFERFEYCDARLSVEDFFWNDFCDNYLELIKARAYEADPSALRTLYHCLDAVLRLFAPFVPHVTEEIYHHLFPRHGSIHARERWPRSADYPVDDAAEATGIAVVEALNFMRKAKSEAGVSIKFPVEHVALEAGLLARITPSLADLMAAGNVTGKIEAGEPAVKLAPKEDVA